MPASARQEQVLRVLLTLLLPWVPLLAVHAVWTPMYQTNDDIWISMTAKGVGLVSEPSSHVIVPHILYGWVLVQLYKLLPWISWHGVMVTGLHLLSTMAVAHLALKRGLRSRSSLLLVLYLATIDAWFYALPQFTVSAALAASAAAVLWLQSVLAGEALSLRRQLAIVLLALAGSMVRFESAAMIAMATAPVVLALTLQALCRRIQTRPIQVPIFAPSARATQLPGFAPWLTLFVVGTLCVGARMLDRSLYDRDKSWKDVVKYNDVVTQFVDYWHIQYTPQTKPIFDRVGWSANDYMLLKTWAFFDGNVYSLEKLREVAGQFPPPQTQDVPWVHRLQWLLQDEALWMMLTLLAAGCVLTKLRHWPLLVMSWAGPVGVSLMLLLADRFLPRIYLSLTALLTMLAVCLASLPASGAEAAPLQSGWRTPWQSLAGALAVLLVLGGMVRSAGELLRQGPLRRAAMADFRAALAKLQQDPQAFYIVSGSSLPLELLTPWDSLERVRNLHFLFLGNTQRTPDAQANWRKYALADPFLDACLNSKVRLITSRSLAQQFIRRASERQQLSVDLLRLAHHPIAGNTGFSVFQLQKADPARNFATLASDPAVLQEHVDHWLDMLDLTPRSRDNVRSILFEASSPADLAQRAAQVHRLLAKGFMDRQQPLWSQHHADAARWIDEHLIQP